MKRLILLAVLVLGSGCGPDRGVRGAHSQPATAGGSWGYNASQARSRAPVAGYDDKGMDPGERAAAYARSLHGRPYCWGGRGPDCFDCSGLTQTAWRWAGKSIPRISRMQRRKLRRIHWSRIRPGDVVWRPGHVGMYVGHGWAIHAPGKGKTVQYQPVNRFKSAHRPQ